jgi:hypothetical protein
LGNVRLGNISTTELEGSPAVLLPGATVNCTVTRWACYVAESVKMFSVSNLHQVQISMFLLVLVDTIAGLTGCRVLTTDDFEAGTVNVTVSPASAQPYSVGSARISSAGDTADVALTDSVALLDLTFSAAPLALSNQGKLQGAVRLRG